ncbi:MAG: glycosyltransferase family 4 protein [Candidatus Helarchaeota archaeon]
MNILFILSQVQKGGGQVIQALNLAKYLIKENNDVRIVTFRSKETNEDVKEDLGVFQIYYFPFTASLLKLLIAPFIVNKVRKVLEDWKIDVIQTFDPHLSTLIGVLLGRRMKVSVICRIGGKYREFYEDKLLKGNFVAKLFYYTRIPSISLKILEYYTFRRVNTVISNSKYILQVFRQSRLIKSAKFNWEIIPNGVDLKRFNPALTIPEALSAHYSGKYIILYLGRIEDYKGIDTLIKAMPQVQAKIPEVHLIIIGSARFNLKCYKELKILAAKLGVTHFLSFLGEISHNQIPYYLYLANVVVLPSYSPKIPINEGVPNVILETMAAQRLIVATNVGGVPEVIEDGKNGVLFTPNHPNELANILITIFSNPKKYGKMASNGRKYLVKNHTFEDVSKRYFKIYEFSLKSGV